MRLCALDTLNLQFGSIQFSLCSGVWVPKSARCSAAYYCLFNYPRGCCPMIVASHLLAAALFGSMVFFSFIMAPLIFTQLDEATAGRFIRAVFPWYYIVLVVLSGLCAVFLFLPAPLEAGVMLAIASLALVSRQVLMPAINGYRDRANQGDTVAESRFNQLHRASVIINMVQLVGVTLVVILLARA